MKKKFLTREYKKSKAIKWRWRKPQSHHSKIRRKLRQSRRMPNPGYGSPKAGRRTIMVIHNIGELKGISGTVRISRTVGMRKRIEILKAAEKMKVKVSNADLGSLMKRREPKEAKKAPKKEAKKEIKEKAKEEPKKEARAEPKKGAGKEPEKEAKKVAAGKKTAGKKAAQKKGAKVK